jgi:HrpA-like RNA helicase
MEKFPSPSIRIESISNELLRLMKIPNIKSIKNLKHILDEFIEPPKKENIESELKYLLKLKLLTSIDDDGELTLIGSTIADMQIEPEKGLSLITAYKLNCFREVTSILAVLEITKSSIEKLFVLPLNIIDEEPKDDKSIKQIKWLTGKFENAKTHFNNRYGDHIAILKIFKEYEEHRDNSTYLNKWLYANFLSYDTLTAAYDLYVKMKRRYRPILSELELDKPDQSVLDIDIKYKVMAALIYGYHENILRIKHKNIQTINKIKNISNIKIEKYSFCDVDVNDPLTASTDLFYDQLWRFDNNPIKAKIVTKVSQKSLDIIDLIN